MPSTIEKILAASSYSEDTQHRLARIYNVLHDPRSYEDTTDMNSTPAPVAQPKRRNRKPRFTNPLLDADGHLNALGFTLVFIGFGVLGSIAHV